MFASIQRRRQTGTSTNSGVFNSILRVKVKVLSFKHPRRFLCLNIQVTMYGLNLNSGRPLRFINRWVKALHDAGPINEKTAHLIQIAAAAAIRSEGGVHSHVRRALKAKAKPAEIYHSIVLLTSTIGFPAVAAALSWARDILENEKK